MYYTADYSSPVGKLVIASDSDSLVGLWIEGQKYFYDTVKGPFEARSDIPVSGKL